MTDALNIANSLKIFGQVIFSPKEFSKSIILGENVAAGFLQYGVALSIAIVTAHVSSAIHSEHKLPPDDVMIVMQVAYSAIIFIPSSAIICLYVGKFVPAHILQVYLYLWSASIIANCALLFAGNLTDLLILSFGNVPPILVVNLLKTALLLHAYTIILKELLSVSTIVTLILQCGNVALFYFIMEPMQQILVSLQHEL